MNVSHGCTGQKVRGSQKTYNGNNDYLYQFFFLQYQQEDIKIIYRIADNCDLLVALEDMSGHLKNHYDSSCEQHGYW